MGCDIHTIVQIKRNNKWEYIPELPKEFNERNYSTFSLLADVRNNFNTKGFQPKGLPSDLETKKFGWESCMPRAKERFKTETTEMVKMPNDKYLSKYDRCFERATTEEEYNSWKGSKGYRSVENGREYYVADYSMLDGVLVDVPYKELFNTFDDFLKEHYEYYFDKDLNDYGEWKVDFTCEDFHSHSYLTLKELQDFDYEDYASAKCKVVKAFMTKFFELGGKLPNGMSVEDSEPQDIRDILAEAIEPRVVVKWKNQDVEDLPVLNGIKELEKIAKQYNIESEDIRIVFAFDN